MGFGEHVLDLFTGPDIPVRHIMGKHLRLPLRFQALSLSHRLHNGKGQRRVNSHLNQIDHNIISTADGSGNGGLSFLNQSTGIAQPYIGTMTQTGNTHQIRKGLGFRIQ